MPPFRSLCLFSVLTALSACSSAETLLFTNEPLTTTANDLVSDGAGNSAASLPNLTGRALPFRALNVELVEGRYQIDRTRRGSFGLTVPTADVLVLQIGNREILLGKLSGSASIFAGQVDGSSVGLRFDETGASVARATILYIPDDATELPDGVITGGIIRGYGGWRTDPDAMPDDGRVRYTGNSVVYAANLARETVLTGDDVESLLTGQSLGSEGDVNLLVDFGTNAVTGAVHDGEWTILIDDGLVSGTGFSGDLIGDFEDSSSVVLNDGSVSGAFFGNQQGLPGSAIGFGFDALFDDGGNVGRLYGIGTANGQSVP